MERLSTAAGLCARAARASPRSPTVHVLVSSSASQRWSTRNLSVAAITGSVAASVGSSSLPCPFSTAPPSSTHISLVSIPATAFPRNGNGIAAPPRRAAGNFRINCRRRRRRTVRDAATRYGPSTEEASLTDLLHGLTNRSLRDVKLAITTICDQPHSAFTAIKSPRTQFIQPQPAPRLPTPATLLHRPTSSCCLYTA